MKKLLITGFDPFDGATINPAWEAVIRLPDQIGAYTLHKLQIPTVFGLAADTLLAEAAGIQPDVVLCIGQAGGRAFVTPERIGINCRHARTCDNQGKAPQNEYILPDGPDGIFATVPVCAMAEAITAAGLPGAVSNTAGTFVCNETLYRVLVHFANTPVRAGFIHVPYLPEQGTPSLKLEDTVRALIAAIGAL